MTRIFSAIWPFSIEAGLNRAYGQALSRHGATAQGVFWNSPKSQRAGFPHFLALWPVMQPAGQANAAPSVADIGCGYGAMLSFMQKDRPQIGSWPYLGFDINLGHDRCRTAHYHMPQRASRLSCHHHGWITPCFQAGKTTLLNRVLNNREGRRVAVIVNDMSEVNIDADLVRADTELSRTDETLVEMSNGCICCTLRDDLLEEVRRLAEEDRFDYLLIESTGISEPLPVAATFDFRDEEGVSLSDVARLDTMVTVVDAVNLLNDYSSHDFLRDRGETMGEEDDRTLVHLLTDQIEFADVVVLNKVADATLNQVDAARKIIRSLNADAKIIETNHSDVPADSILDTGMFDFEKAHEHAMWAKELFGYEDHTPETEEYGITSFIYRARQPFHPERIHAVLNGDLPGVIRAKGHFWIATRPDWVAEFSPCRRALQRRAGNAWWAAVPEERWPQHERAPVSEGPLAGTLG